MTGPKKLLIITSNEDLIHQFLSQEIKDTYIIDLDKNTNILDNLSQLTQINSSKDQQSKRLLDSSDDYQSKSLKIRKKSDDYNCLICGDHAIGYNYDVLSCASCKIFFRRNANQDLKTMKCLIGTYECRIECGKRRKCPQCRLKRCFTMGMKKEFLLTEEEKQKRKKVDHISTNVPKPSNILNRSSCELLSIEDQSIIENIRLSFRSILDEGKEQQCACVDVTDRTSALITWSEYIQKVTLTCIKFLRQIEQFEKLNFDDRLTLIKYNVLPVTLILKSYYYKSKNDCCSDDDNEHAVRQRRFFFLCSGTTEARKIFVNMIVNLVDVTKQDPIILSVLSVILVFSRGLSMDENEPMLKDSKSVCQTEFYYIKLLWNYLVHQFGQIESEKYFSKLITLILKIQLTSKQLRQYFHTQYITSNTVDRMAPILQSLLRI